MNLNRALRYPQLRAMAVLYVLMAALLSGTTARGSGVRIANWDMRSTGGDSGGKKLEARVNHAVGGLEQLRAEVIVLHWVRDWDMAAQVARGLGNYRVVLCSQFPVHSGARPGSGQLAILAREKPYFAWLETWHPEGGQEPPGGIALAAFDLGGRRLGVFAVQLPEPEGGSPGEKRLQQWLSSVNSYGAWTSNRMEAAVVSAALVRAEKSRLEEKLPKWFSDRFLGIPFKDHLDLEPGDSRVLTARLAADAGRPEAVVLAGMPIAFDLELSTGVIAERTGAKAAPELSGRAEAGSGTRLGNWLIRARPAQGRTTRLLTWSTAVALIVVVAWRWRRRQSRTAGEARSAGRNVMRLPPETLTSGTTTEATGAPMSTSGSSGGAVTGTRPVFVVEAKPVPGNGGDAEPERLREQAASWLKERFISALVSDRAALLKHQSHADLRVMVVNDRLRKIEEQLRTQSYLYEERIDELNRQLEAAREESRALIQAKVCQVKAELESARALLIEGQESK